MVAKIRVYMLFPSCWPLLVRKSENRWWSIFRPWDRCIGEIWCLEPKTSDFVTFLNKSRLAVRAVFCFKTSKKPRCRVCMKTRKWPLWAFFRENVSRHEWWLKYVFTCYFHGRFFDPGTGCWPLLVRKSEKTRKSVMVVFTFFDHFWEEKRKSVMVDFSTLGEIWCLEPKTSDFVTFLNKSRLAVRAVFCFKTSKKPRCRVCMKTRKWPLWAFFRENVSRHEWWLKYVFTCYFHLVDHFWWGKAKIGDGRFFDPGTGA